MKVSRRLWGLCLLFVLLPVAWGQLSPFTISKVEIEHRGPPAVSDEKLRKKLASKVGEPLDERKLFTDSQEIQKKYQQAGYPRTVVTYSFTHDEAAGKAIATFEIVESPKVRISEIHFVGAQAFSQRK